MSIKRTIAVGVVGFILTSCSSSGWSCKARYVNAKPIITNKNAA